MSEPQRAVVIGASGIGKHHVKWLMRAGCDVVGFLGSTEESVARSAAMLREQLGFAGRGYASMAALLGECRPQLASVCTPMAEHYAHVMALLGAGACVLCEKPLVGGADLGAEAQLFLGARLVQAAEKLGLPLSVNTQYAAAAEHLRAICEQAGVPPSPVRDCFMQMESRGGGGRRGEAIWHDLAAHPISVLLALIPNGEVDWASVRCVIEAERNECTFDFAPPGGPTCRVRFLLRNVPEGPMQRQFTLNGVNVKYEGRNNENGVYCAYLTHGEQELRATDFIEDSIVRFAQAARGEGEPRVSGRMGLRNLELQLRLAERAES